MRFYRTIVQPLKAMLNRSDRKKGIWVIVLTVLNTLSKRRSVAYFGSICHPQMDDLYFHHSFDMFRKFNFEIMYDPSSIKNRILRKWVEKDLSPFPWIKIILG